MKRNNNSELISQIRSKYELELLDFILTYVATKYNYHPNFLQNKTTDRDVIRIKQMACYLIYTNIEIPIVKLAKIFDVHHSTIIYYNKTMSGYVRVDKDFRKEINEIQEKISEKAHSLINKAKFNDDFLYINLDVFYSIDLGDGKRAIFAGYENKEDIPEFLNIDRNNLKMHNKTKLYHLEIKQK